MLISNFKKKLKKRSEFWQNGLKSHKDCRKLATEVVEITFDTQKNVEEVTYPELELILLSMARLYRIYGLELYEGHLIRKRFERVSEEKITIPSTYDANN